VRIKVAIVRFTMCMGLTARLGRTLCASGQTKARPRNARAKGAILLKKEAPPLRRSTSECSSAGKLLLFGLGRRLRGGVVFFAINVA